MGAKIYQKLASLDLSSLILSKAVPVAVTHADLYKNVKKSIPNLGGNSNSGSGVVVETEVLNKLTNSASLHKAMHSRAAEIQYLRKIAELLVAKLIDQDRLAGWPQDGHLRWDTVEIAFISTPEAREIRCFNRYVVISCTICIEMIT